ncbi:MAG: WD40 repeat domain-containing protein [Gammaproteobacteria bacterium]|nr:WD40 repeat domain-containing protein [Gammaproteobacteria bacterium]
MYEASSLKLLGQIPVSRSSISVSQNANRLAYDTSTDEKRGAVWDLSNVSPLLALPPENEAIGYAHNSTMSSNGKYVMAFNPIDQRRIKVGKVKIWEVETGEVKAILENVDFSCESGAFIAFDEWIAFNCNKSLDIYDVSTGGFLVSIPISHENISKSVLTPDRHGLVIASDKGEIRYLNLWKTRKDLIDWATKQLRKIKPMDEKTCERRFINSMVCDALQGTDKLTSDKG